MFCCRRCKMAAILLFVLIFLITLYQAIAKPSQGVWNLNVDKEHTVLFLTKSAFTNTQLSVSITCENEKDLSFKTVWFLGKLECANIYFNESKAALTAVSNDNGPIKNIVNETSIHSCTKNGHFFVHPEKKSSNSIKTSESDIEPSTLTTTTQSNQAGLPQKMDYNSSQLVKVENDGYYLFVIHFSQANYLTPLPDDFILKVHIRFSDGDSYIAAVDWPLLYFYGIMGLVYIFYGIFWLVLLACNWRDLLRVQFWIGGVILLGMLEKAVFFAEYENVNKTGQSVKGAIIFAELVSCLKRTLARMLVIIVSLGYGIVKQRLEQTFHKILIVGVLFFILASIEGCMRVLTEKTDQSRQLMLPGIPLAVTDLLIYIWILISLLRTTRTLRLRRNIVKLSLYRHFTNTLIFAVLASVAYMIWSVTQHKFKNCLTDWKNLWVDEAFWDILFSFILFVIMMLWRPTAYNLKYAFSPLLDAAEDELEDDHVLTDAYDGIKIRTKPQKINGIHNATDTNEDDLKSVEENIPDFFADKLLSVLDLDEEIMNATSEVSKME